MLIMGCNTIIVRWLGNFVYNPFLIGKFTGKGRKFIYGEKRYDSETA